MRKPESASNSKSVTVEALEGRRLLSGQPVRRPEDYLSEQLTEADVQQILAQAASQALSQQMIFVVDRDGVILGSLQMADAPTKPRARDRISGKAIARARTAAFFESTEDAFTTRTARFIIQDNFPFPVQNTPGGPLYGVEFSTQPGSDAAPTSMTNLPKRAVPLNISGDPGGIPLYKNGIPVGGIGVAGDGHDVGVRKDLVPVLNDPDNPKGESYTGQEEKDRDEAVALAGAQDFMAPERIRATQIFLGGLRFPFTKDSPAKGNPTLTYQQVLNQGVATVLNATQDSPPPIYPNAVYGGVVGQLKNLATADSQTDPYGTTGSKKKGRHLTEADVDGIIADAVNEAKILRAAIREPEGRPVLVHIAVVDTRGDILGVFREGDGTNFSFDVAVQKARTAVYFSDDAHALSPTSVGFLAQGGGFPPGIKDSGPGPLFGIQNDLSLRPGNFHGILLNGLTIFPGGAPLYKNGTLVGAIGISGDGVEQDSKIGFFGAKRFQAPRDIRVDALSTNELTGFISNKIEQIIAEFDISDTVAARSRSRIMEGLDNVRVPFQKFSRNMEL